jgi:dihydroflavonol-4-reductase
MEGAQQRLGDEPFESSACSAPSYRSWWGQRGVLVTGATGFLGVHLVRQLLAAGARVTILARSAQKAQLLAHAGASVVLGDITDRDALCRAAKGAELIFHLAGVVNFQVSFREAWEVNYGGTRHVYQVARELQVARLIYTSSLACIGATRTPELLDEKSSWPCFLKNIPYIYSKRVAEEYLLEQSGRVGPEVVILNPGALIGPDDYWRSEFGTLCRRFLRGRVPVSFPGGTNFVDVRDVAAGHLKAAIDGRGGERYILGAVNLSFANFSDALARAARKVRPRLVLPRALATVVARANEWFLRDSGRRSYLSPAQAALVGWYFYCSYRKATNELGYRPRPWHQTLRDTVQYWLGPSRSAAAFGALLGGSEGLRHRRDRVSGPSLSHVPGDTRRACA